MGAAVAAAVVVVVVTSPTSPPAALISSSVCQGWRATSAFMSLAWMRWQRAEVMYIWRATIRHSPQASPSRKAPCAVQRRHTERERAGVRVGLGLGLGLRLGLGLEHRP